MVESLSLFIGIMLSMAVITSMMFNPRRLEAPGYSLSVLLLQVLMAGHEDIFFLCPQFPMYVSPLDENLDPDVTTSDSQARGVYVDAALLLVRCTRSEEDDTGSIGRAFDMAHQGRNFDLFGELDIISLNAPILEERKRGPTRHPDDIQKYIRSIHDELVAAQRQVVTQAQILFSSPRFADQDLVILLATAGEFYSIAVLQRDHPALETTPDAYVIDGLIEVQKEDAAALGKNSTDLCAELLNASVIKKQKEQIERERREQAKKRTEIRRKAAAEARAARQKALPKLVKGSREKTFSQFIIEAGSPPYEDETIEKCYRLLNLPSRETRRYSGFFERVPMPNESIYSLAGLRHAKKDRLVIFTGAIRVGSPASDAFVKMIRAYLAELADDERAHRASLPS